MARSLLDTMPANERASYLVFCLLLEMWPKGVEYPKWKDVREKLIKELKRKAVEDL